MVKEWFHYRSLRALTRGAWKYVFVKRRNLSIRRWRLFYRLRLLMVTAAAGLTQKFPRTSVRLWVDREAFPRIRKLISRARHTIIIQMFIWVDDELGRSMAQLLTEAADRGVKVYITKESVGDMFETRGDFLTTREDPREVWRKFWGHKNIRISHSTQADHTKVYIIDDHIFLLTGMNIANEYHESWHDYLVELHGSQFVRQYLTRSPLDRFAGSVRLVMNSEVRKEIRPVVMDLIHSARRSIVIEQAYFSDPLVIDALIGRSKEGVMVTVILPKTTDIHHYSNMKSLTRILLEGEQKHVQIFLSPRMIHGKIILVDHQHAFLGSANLITSSLDEMGEVNVLIDGKGSAAFQKLLDVLRDDLLISRPLNSPPVLAWFSGWLAWLKL